MDGSKIEWTDATWNPLRGCSRVSEGCRNCYAERIAARFSQEIWDGPHDAVAVMTKYGPRWTGKVNLVESKLDQPLRWKTPRRIFVTSMSDAHNDKVPDEWRDKILAVIALTPHHTYQWLTKRAEAMRAYFSDPGTPFRVQKAMDALAVDARHDAVEEWRAVVGYEGHYEVSSHGRVRSKTSRPVKPRPRGEDYRAVALSKNGEVRDRLVQHLVLEAFVGPARPNEEARHANGNRSDNRAVNLSWGTHTENMADAVRHGTAGAWMKGRATLTAEQVAEIRRRRKSGEKLDDIAAIVGSNKKHVSAIARGVIYKTAALIWPLPNLWLGVSVEDQASADERIPFLLQTPAAVRWVSYEPALGPVNFTLAPFGYDNHIQPHNFLDWIVIGGESGPRARPFDLAWARDVIGQCKAAGVPVFVKQLGARQLLDGVPRSPAHTLKSKKGGDMTEWPEDLRIREWPALVKPKIAG